MYLRISKISLLFCLMLAFTGFIVADNNISYSYVEANYFETTAENGPDGKGFNLELSSELGEMLYLFGNYSDTDFDSVDVEEFANLGNVQFDRTTLGAGVGAHIELGSRVSLFGQGQFVKTDVDAIDGGESSDTGYAGAAGVRVTVNSNLEMEARAARADLEDSDAETLYRAVARFKVTKNLALQGGYGWNGNSDDIVFGGLRANF